MLWLVPPSTDALSTALYSDNRRAIGELLMLRATSYFMPVLGSIGVKGKDSYGSVDGHRHFDARRERR